MVDKVQESKNVVDGCAGMKPELPRVDLYSLYGQLIVQREEIDLRIRSVRTEIEKAKLAHK